MQRLHVKHFSFKLTSFSQQPFEAGTIILPIVIAPNREGEDVMPPFISDSYQYSALFLVSPCMVSHMPFCWVVSDFPNSLKFFLEQGRVCRDFSSNPQNSRCQNPTDLTRAMSRKEPGKSLCASSFLFSVHLHTAHGLVLREANHIQAHAEKQVQSHSAGRNADPTLSSSQVMQPEPAASTTLSGSVKWWRGLR